MKIPPTFQAFLLAALGQGFFAQAQASWTLWPGLLLFAAALFLLRLSPLTRPSPAEKVPDEKFMVLALFGLALLARTWRLDVLPAGLHRDQAQIGLSALRILNEGWRPGLDSLYYQNPFPLEFYSLAPWFAFAGASLLALRSYFVLLSLGALLFSYLFFRRLAGPKTALLAFFFMAILRWDWNECRAPHSSAEAPLYLMVMLFFFLEWTGSPKPLLLAGSALCAGLGLYAYQSLKALPLLFLALLFLERKRDRKSLTGGVSGPVLSLGLLALLALPLAYSSLAHGSLGKREGEIFVLKKVWMEKDPSALWRSWSGTLLMLGREGTQDPFHNLPGKRMLDDPMAVFFLLGLAGAWRRRKERTGTYPLLAFGLMALPGLMAVDPGPPHRFTVLIPFTAYFASLGAWGVWDSLASWRKKTPAAWGLAAALILLASGAQEAWTYFHSQALDQRCVEASGLEQNKIGGTIQSLEVEKPKAYGYFLSPLYFRDPTVDFLNYDLRNRIQKFDPSQIAYGSFPKEKPAVFFLEGGLTGILDLLRDSFPQGQGERALNGAGSVFLLRYDISPISLKAYHGWSGGLKGTFLSGPGPVTFFRTDPLLNDPSLKDLPWAEEGLPYRASWKGNLSIREKGVYYLKVLSSDESHLWLGEKEVGEGPLELEKGGHPLRVEFQKKEGYYAALHLVWKRPGMGDWEVVPASAFGKLNP